MSKWPVHTCVRDQNEVLRPSAAQLISYFMHLASYQIKEDPLFIG